MPTGHIKPLFHEKTLAKAMAGFPAMQHRAAEAQQHERRLADLVNQAYGLTPEEIDLMWKTAPPRMPVGEK